MIAEEERPLHLLCRMIRSTAGRLSADQQKRILKIL
nr:MAG TPA: hypothetical protein [Caudoviricetes sp.]DAH30147.1 MAG TPA: hypothetical protein [Caudoviricetes sp.]